MHAERQRTRIACLRAPLGKPQLAALLSFGLLLLGAPVASAAGLRAGCAKGRPAIAYRAGATAALRPQPGGAPTPCLSVIDERTSESADVGVLNSGRILYAPLVENSLPAPADDRGPAEIAASSDSGAHWQTILPGDTNHILDVPPWMSVDPQTQRIWFATVLPDLCGAEISWSDDGGNTWQTNPAVGCPAMGSESILEGSAPAGGATPTGYPNVVYYCANLNDLSQSELFCYRSLSGGTTFAYTGSNPDPAPEPGCATEHPARPGAVGTEGYLYFPVYQCGQLSMAISRDEGATWQHVPVTASAVQDLYTTSVAVDPAGNIYLAWIQLAPGASQTPASGGGPNPATEAIDGQGVPVLAVSRDHGLSWSRPVSIGPPGVTDAQMIAVASHGVGQVAVSYLANTNRSSLLDGWLAETSDALAPNPTWWAVSLNDPATPIIDSSQSTSFGNRLFFNTDTYAPDGEPYAAFHCAFTSACPGERIGVVGWLAKAGAAASPRRHHVRRHRARRRSAPRHRARSRARFTG